MATISNILSDKGQQVWTVRPNATALQAAQVMNEHKVGALVVTEEHGHVVGIFSERDVLRRIVAKSVEPASVTVGNVMTEEVICIRPEIDLEEARGICMKRRIRHLPVVDQSNVLLGMVSIGDLNAYDLTGHKRTIYYLHEYLYGT